MRSVEGTGKTIADAVRSCLVKLGLIEDEVTVEVLEEPKSGFLGFGNKPARVRVTEKENIHTGLEVPETAAPSAIKTQEAQPVSISAAIPAVPSEETSFTVEEAATKAKNFLQTVLTRMGLSVMIEKMIKPDKIILHIHGKNLGVLIGKHGQTLDALQYLTNLTTNQNENERYFVMLDIENYRHRREIALRKLALRLAARVRQTKEDVVLEPMNGYERKIIHLALQQEEHVQTDSDGQEPYRHVVIHYEV